MKKLSIPWFWMIGALLLAAIGYFALVPKPVLVESTVLQSGTFREVFRTDGRIRSKDKKTVVAFADGDLKEVTLRAGDVVKKGEAVAVNIWDANRELKSPIDGVVSKVFRTTAGPIRRGEPVLEIVSNDNLEVVADLLTTDAVRISEGTKVTVLGWGGDTPIEAIVHLVSRAGFTKTSALGVEEERAEVRANLLNPPPQIVSRLGDNYHVDVEYALSEEENALTMPIGALFKVGEDWAVYKIVDGRAVKTIIQLGKKNDREVIVTAGLSAGDSVVLYPGDLITDGIRVRNQ